MMVTPDGHSRLELSVKWFSTRTRIDSAISAARKDFSSGWPRKSQIGEVPKLEVAASLTRCPLPIPKQRVKAALVQGRFL
jgi:hypothetical protein